MASPTCSTPASARLPTSSPEEVWALARGGPVVARHSVGFMTTRHEVPEAETIVSERDGFNVVRKHEDVRQVIE